MENLKTEPMENLHQPLCTFKCRKVIMRECPHINILSIGTSSYLNVETEPKTKWCGDGEMGKLNQWKICNWEMEYQHWSL